MSCVTNLTDITLPHPIPPHPITTSPTPHHHITPLLISQPHNSLSHVLVTLPLFRYPLILLSHYPCSIPLPFFTGPLLHYPLVFSRYITLVPLPFFTGPLLHYPLVFSRYITLIPLPSIAGPTLGGWISRHHLRRYGENGGS